MDLRLGNKVIYMGRKHQMVYDSCDDPKGKLTLGAVYEVESVNVKSSHTAITLVGVYMRRFDVRSFRKVDGM